MKKLLIGLAAAATLLAAGCGGDGDTTAASTATSAESAAASSASSASTASSAAPETTAKAPASTTAATIATTATTPAAAASGGSLAVVLEDDPWSIKANTTVPAGKIAFTATNEGSVPHELVVIKGSYAALAKSDIGAVLEDQLPAGALIGRTERIAAGASASIEYDLTAGKYTLLCNIAAGPNSHAGKGQVLDITVG